MSYFSAQAILTVSEIAALLRISTITVYKYIREKDLEAFEIGGHYRVTKEAFEKFLENHKVKK